MPDPVQYASAFLLTALAAGLPCWLIGRWGSRYSPSRIALLTLACAIGALVLGYWRLGISPHWPPRNGLDRLLAIGLPLAVALETLSLTTKVPRRAITGLRVAGSVVIVGTLLFGSVYLRDGVDSWLTPLRLIALSGCAAALAFAWESTPRLATRIGAASLLTAISAAILSAGLVVLLAGYIKGGAAAIPWSAMLAGFALVMRTKPAAQAGSRISLASQPVAGLAIVALFGVLFVGRFFGGIGNYEALAIFAPPSLLWLLELRVVKRWPRWVRRLLAVALIVAPLAIVIFQAKAAFDRKLGKIVSTTSRELRQDFIDSSSTRRHSAHRRFNSVRPTSSTHLACNSIINLRRLAASPARLGGLGSSQSRDCWRPSVLERARRRSHSSPRPTTLAGLPNSFVRI